jgi:hypothetical protein
MYAYRGILIALGAAVVGILAPAAVRACTLSVADNGGLNMSQANPTQLGSEQTTTDAATMTTILPLVGGGVVIDVGTPTLVQQPAGYGFATSTTEVRYRATATLGLLLIKDQAYTSATTSFPTGALGALTTVTLVLHNRITNTAGFPAGHYQTRTIVTCHP